MQNIWTDPVWSKVIAAGLIAVFGFVLRLLWGKFFGQNKKQTIPSKDNPTQTILSSETVQALMLIGVNPAVLESQFDDAVAYQQLLDQFLLDELITTNENNIPSLTKKGQKLVKKQRKLEEKIRD